jgi:hypothetical protein
MTERCWLLWSAEIHGPARDHCHGRSAVEANSARAGCVLESEASCWPGPLQPLGHSQRIQQTTSPHPPAPLDASEDACVIGRTTAAAAADAGSQFCSKAVKEPASADAALPRTDCCGRCGVHRSSTPRTPGIGTLPVAVSQLAEAPGVQHSSAAQLPPARSQPAAAQPAAAQPAAVSGLGPLQVTTQPACPSPGSAFQLPLDSPNRPARENTPSQWNSAHVPARQPDGENGAELLLPLPVPWVQPSQADSCGCPAQGLPDADTSMEVIQRLPPGNASSPRAPLAPMHR